VWRSETDRDGPLTGSSWQWGYRGGAVLRIRPLLEIARFELRMLSLEYPARMDPYDGPTLIAFDGSAAARRAVAAAAALLKPRLTLVLTVWEAALAHAAVAPPPDVAMTPAVDPSQVLMFDDALRAHADRVANEGAELARSLGLDAEPLAMAGVPDVARTIVEVARERNAGTIVVGSRGLSGLRARLEGSTSKGVVKHAPCPVIVVHDAGAEESG
jgi:nucleotide-binding universal stress UspA family protein